MQMQGMMENVEDFSYCINEFTQQWDIIVIAMSLPNP